MRPCNDFVGNCIGPRPADIGENNKDGEMLSRLPTKGSQLEIIPGVKHTTAIKAASDEPCPDLKLTFGAYETPKWCR